MTSYRGPALVLGSAVSNQTGAAVAVHAFPALGPIGVVAVRQLVAAAVLLPVARPDLRTLTRAQWQPVLLLAAVFCIMNLSLYTAVERLGLGLAVTLEFLGPLAVALAGSRTRRDLLVALAAAGGVYALVLPSASTDWTGVALGLTAASCWAAYILLNRLLGQRLPGLQAAALASGGAAAVAVPHVVLLAVRGHLAPAALGWAVAAGVLASVVPYAADLTALRHLPTRAFGVLMSVHPAVAALAGLLVLGQVLDTHEWAGITVIVLANAVTVATARPA